MGLIIDIFCPTLFFHFIFILIFFGLSHSTMSTDNIEIMDYF